MKKHNQYYQEIIEYYTASNWLYKYVWALGGSRGLHFGFAESSTKSHTEALSNQYRFVIKSGRIKDSSRVLDAGCGVGGAAVFIVRQTGARVVGISLVSKQIEDARDYAEKIGVADKATFMVGDYTKTGLDTESFDVVFGMESVCYASPKQAFLREAYRLLKPGGFLVLSDGYKKRSVKKEEKGLMRRFLNGWKLAELVSHEEMLEEMKKAGFKVVFEEEVTKKTKMSIKRMQKLVWLWKIVGKRVVGWIKHPLVFAARENAEAMEGWIGGVESGLFGYYTHVACKPR